MPGAAHRHRYTPPARLLRTRAACRRRARRCAVRGAPAAARASEIPGSSTARAPRPANARSADGSQAIAPVRASRRWRPRAARSVAVRSAGARGESTARRNARIWARDSYRPATARPWRAPPRHPRTSIASAAARARRIPACRRAAGCTRRACETRVRDREAGLVQQRRPARRCSVGGSGCGTACAYSARAVAATRRACSRSIAIAGRRNVLDGGSARRRARTCSAQQVVEHAQAQRAADRIDARDVELRERRRHDREPSRQNRRALGLQRLGSRSRRWPAREPCAAQPGKALGRDAASGQAVLLEDVGQRQRGSRRCIRVAPALPARNRARWPRLRRAPRCPPPRRPMRSGYRPRKSAASCRRSRFQRLEALRGETAADDEFGRAAADVDDEPRLVGRRQHMGDADVDEPRFLVAGDDVDAESPARARPAAGTACDVRGDAKRVGRNGAHGGGMEPFDAFAEAGQAGERAALCLRRVSRPLSSMPAPMRSVSRQVSRR